MTGTGTVAVRRGRRDQCYNEKSSFCFELLILFWNKPLPTARMRRINGISCNNPPLSTTPPLLITDLAEGQKKIEDLQQTPLVFVRFATREGLLQEIPLIRNNEWPFSFHYRPNCNTRVHLRIRIRLQIPGIRLARSYNRCDRTKNL